MSDLAKPLPLEEPREGLLARIAARPIALSWELAAYLALLAVGAGMRFWDLGSRALHHDESLHGYYAYQLFLGNGYEHDPLMHGPFQFFGMALTFFLTGGASDYTVRVFPALFGTALIVLPFFLRPWLGRWGALFASALIAFSPTLLYFSRFARNDIYIAVFTLGLVIALWRYMEEGRHRYLYIAAALLGLSFATKENTFLNVGVLLAFLNIWFALDLARQSLRRFGEPPSMYPFYALLYLPWAWAVAALWPFLGGLRQRLGLEERHRSADFLLILGTLSLPQFAALVQVPLETIFNVELKTVGAEKAWGFPTVIALIGATALVGLRWNPRVWAIAAACFYVPYALLYTSFLTNPPGFASGIWESLDYWLDQQDVRRGGQPWFYYLMLLPAYEFLPLLVAAPALLLYALRGDPFRRFLVFWVVATFAAYTWAGEKMPWLSVHTTLPVILLAAHALGRLPAALPPPHRLQALAPALLPWAAAALGMAAVGMAVFGPASGPWIALRVFLVALALGLLVVALRPFDRRRLALGLAAAALGALALFTLRAGVIATYEHGDVPRELLVYTQTSPQVPDILERIQEAGRVSGRGRELPVFVDTTYTWPWAWYLRDYPNRRFGGVGEGFMPEENAVLLIASENEGRVEPFLDRYQQPTRFYLRWWFPENYRGIQRDSIFEAAADFLASLFQRSTWENWWRFFKDRDVQPAGVQMTAYFPTAYGVGEPAAVAEPEEPLPPPPIDAQGRFAMGQVGGRPGAFREPTGLAVDSEGNLYVADTGNHRIQIFDPQGRFLRELGGPGEGPGQFNQPGDVILDAQGNLYVVDTWNHRIQVFDPELNFVAAFGRPTGDLDNPEPDQMWGPRAIAIDAEGNLLVVDTGTARIKKFSPQGEVLAVYGRRGSADGEFMEPVGIAVAPSGDIWVADTGNRRLQRFDPQFNHLASYYPPQWENLDTAAKPYLAVLPDGRLLVTDASDNEVLLVNSDGTISAALAQIGDTPFVLPRGTAYDEAGGFVYVSEAGAGRIRRFPVSDFPGF